MVKGRRRPGPALSCAGRQPAPAKDKDLDVKEALQSLLANALEDHHLRARPPRETRQPIWNAESTKLTLPGRSIKVRLDGDNVRIYLICTPYVQDNGEVLLLAQGQVWFSTPPDKEVKYFSTFYSIPVSFGEKVLFFPLGVSEAEARQKGFLNVELEIKIVPYDDSTQQQQSPPAQQPQPQQQQ